MPMFGTAGIVGRPKELWTEDEFPVDNLKMTREALTSVQQVPLGNSTSLDTQRMSFQTYPDSSKNNLNKTVNESELSIYY